MNTNPARMTSADILGEWHELTSSTGITGGADRRAALKSEALKRGLFRMDRGLLVG